MRGPGCAWRGNLTPEQQAVIFAIVRRYCTKFSCNMDTHAVGKELLRTWVSSRVEPIDERRAEYVRLHSSEPRPYGFVPEGEQCGDGDED